MELIAPGVSVFVPLLFFVMFAVSGVLVFEELGKSGVDQLECAGWERDTKKEGGGSWRGGTWCGEGQVPVLLFVLFFGGERYLSETLYFLWVLLSYDEPQAESLSTFSSLPAELLLQAPAPGSSNAGHSKYALADVL